MVQCIWPHNSRLCTSGLSSIPAADTIQAVIQSSPLVDPSVIGAIRFGTSTDGSSTDSSASSRSTELVAFAPKTRQSNFWSQGDLIDSVLDDNEDPDAKELQIKLRMTINALGTIQDPDFYELCQFYSIFLTRHIYDYSAVEHDFISVSHRRLTTSASARHAMTGLTFLFRANYDQSHLATPLRRYAGQRYQLALYALQADLANCYLSPVTKLVGLAEILIYDYYSGNFPFYYQRLRLAASLVHQVVGSRTLDVTTMSGDNTIDVRIFSWCDILSSMAMSRPTLFNYRTNIDSSQRNHYPPDVGLEWLSGCPDTLAITLARISNLRHSNLSQFNKLVEATRIEQTVLSWSGLPQGTNRSLQVVSRMAVQEIWRHTALLYLHQAIYKSNAEHCTVQNSMKQIIRLSSTFKAGQNPDCFLAVPYFIAASFAISPQNRSYLRTRLLGCGNEQYLRDLANTLDQLWRETDTTGCHTTWSTKQPPSFIF